jgi:hypothetical protein
MDLVCQHCENVQEEVKITGSYSMKTVNGIKYIKRKGGDWEVDTSRICKNCGKEIEKKIDYTRVNFIGSERNDPSHANYWKNGKTQSQIADVIAGDANPY